MQTTDFKQELVAALAQLMPQASRAHTTRLKAIHKALSQATIPQDDYFRIAVFIFLLYVEMPSTIRLSQALRQLFLMCNDELARRNKPAPPSK
ncbi:MAG: hypothetical protein A3E83_08150 [Gammaproteobacteria bacterium RIFCSPHIGHO2_12_FULL_41_20]|nr:MAG: hypothetical protein A3E83_08150 [Gammaproteobacteria bacterium RIFCSPHIGHO2_12_FULL_41_20]